MRKLMRHEIGLDHEQVRIAEGVLGVSAVVGFMMLQSVAADFIAYGEEKVVVAIVPRAKQRSGFGDQFLEISLLARRQVEIGFVFGDHVENMNRSFSGLREFNFLEVLSGDKR